MSNLFWNLVLKDLGLYRNFIFMSLVSGLFGLVLLTQGATGFFVGSSVSLCTLIVLMITLVQVGMIGEKKSLTHYFVLSLPITGQQYIFAKMTALAISFFVPWFVIGGGALTLISLGPVQGFIPFTITVLMYFPLYFACIVVAASVRKAETASMGVIVFFNVAINLFIPALLRIPSVAETSRGSVAIWTPELLLVISIEIGVAIAVLLLALTLQYKKTEYL